MAEITVQGYVNNPKTVEGGKGPFAVYTLAEGQKQKDGTYKKVYYDCVDFKAAAPPAASSFAKLSGWFNVKEYTKKDGSKGTGLSINVQNLIEVSPPREQAAPAASQASPTDAFDDLPF